MAYPDWYDRNIGRAYPFLTGTVGRPAALPTNLEQLPNAAIADAGFVLGPQAGFDPLIHRVVLDAVRRAGSTFTFDFACDAPGSVGRLLRFTRNLTDAKFTNEFAEVVAHDSDSGSTDVPGCGEPIWSGFLVTGDLTVLAAAMPGNGELTRGNPADAIVEPATIQSLGFVFSINAANRDRTRYEPPVECGGPTDLPTRPNYVSAFCLKGEIELRPGYGSIWRQSSAQSFTISASEGINGFPCEEVPLYDGEVPPKGSTLLSGGPTCFEVVRSISGRPGPSVSLGSAGGILVQVDPNSHRILISVVVDAVPSSESCSISD